MKIQLLTVGKCKEKYILTGIAEFQKRLQTDVKFEIIEVADEKAPERLSDKEMIHVKQKEGERLLHKIKPQSYVVALERQGKMIDSAALANKIQQLTTYGTSDFTFIIGGSLGLSEDVRNRANYEWSFSPLTFPHQLMRLMVTEQIYRAVQINKGTPYHK
ncbi:23S rRNA (pseudouridine(1915)-N(3))-methyltransferase RlmH [Geomicrobium sp. JCM 19039]|uniref:23S rRNA (pseudouridine(1915)-N(3))-methyltransferase RlmH n=1 Tax=Geomicrobium sp. JCM 19039 TaxID=1460636 RepID=UPI00045F2793|nr:23S rRNA (pseudouridine(1915)-N(3))-methyltransferase RlmH [Geomicrobium sp. JCM 19039]GAK12031.1 methyltransferase RlmH [Geomicrobium sp. JCM 19039]